MQRSLHILASGMAATLLLLTLTGYAGHWHPAFEVIANFRLHLAVLAGILGTVLGLVRLRHGAGLALLATLIAAAGLGPVFDPVKRPGDGRPLTLLYANLWDRNPQPKALAAMLRAAGADILITSETPRTVVEGAGGLSTAYPYHLVHSGTGEVLRTAIWSKYPLHNGELYLNNTVAPTGAAAIADLGGGATLGLIGAHFSRPFEGLHRTQIEALGPMAQKLAAQKLTAQKLTAQKPDRPLIIAGDFNASPWIPAVARAAEVTNTRILGGYRITWKGDYQTPLGPLTEPWGHQIDQMLLSSGIGVETVETLALPGSDHLGLLVRLRIPPP
jgi:endonuclease/exonuclease/phosphatase (EEP) superfamily protein YafD